MTTMLATSPEDEPYVGGTDLALYHQPARTVDLRDHATDSWTDVLDDVIRLSRGIANTEFVPKGLRGSVEKVSAAVLFSRELGLMPMTGLGATHVIEGKAGISAEMMRALVLQAGHELHIVESTRERCKIRGRRKGSEQWTEAVWTIQEAHQTQVFVSKEKGWGALASKPQWRSWPTEMLLARATTRLVRMIFPDVVHGMRSVEELQDMTEVVAGELVEGPPAVQPVQRQQRQRVARPAPRTSVEPLAPAAQAEAVQVAAPAAEAVSEPEEAPKTVQRQRVARPAPKTSTPPVAEPVPDADGVIDAEIIAPTQAPTQAPPGEDPRAKGARTTILMHWQRLGITERAERIFYTGALARTEIQTTNDLTVDQLRRVAATLERCRDMAAVEAHLTQQEGTTDGQ